MTDRNYAAFSNVETVVIQSGVQAIAAQAFQSHRNLRSVTIPSTVDSIGNDAFHDCPALETVKITGPVTVIKAQTFIDCTSLSSVELPDSVRIIEDGAFRNCTALTSITLPQSLTTLGDNAFRYCTALKSITIPSKVTTIGSYAFAYCYGLTSVSLPSNLTTINEHAFYSTALSQVTFPKSLNAIGYRAFRDCERLKKITFKGSTAPNNMDSDAFENVTAEGYYPYAGKDNYGSLKRRFRNCSINWHLTNIQMADANVSLKYANMYWTGKARTQSKTAVVTIAAGDTTITLKEGEDYKISYKNNVNRGTATMTFTGLGECKGTTTQTFKIVRQPLTNVNPKVTITYPNMNYTGKPRTQNKYTTVKVTIGGKQVTLEQGVDYKIKYENNTNVGVATMTIYGIGNYTGSITKTFKIIPPKTSITSLSKSGTSVTVKWEKKTAQTTGYLVQYSTSKSFPADNKHTIWVKSPSTVSKVIKNLAKGKTYYFRIRSYKDVDGQKYYSVWSPVKSIAL